MPRDFEIERCRRDVCHRGRRGVVGKRIGDDKAANK
jgi:hypothetical protein